jgi:hypothetical protein
MEFRWVAAIALWTVLSGPIFNGKGGLYAPTNERLSANAGKATSQTKLSKASVIKISIDRVGNASSP